VWIACRLARITVSRRRSLLPLPVLRESSEQGWGEGSFPRPQEKTLTLTLPEYRLPLPTCLSVIDVERYRQGRTFPPPLPGRERNVSATTGCAADRLSAILRSTRGYTPLPLRGRGDRRPSAFARADLRGKQYVVHRSSPERTSGASSMLSVGLRPSGPTGQAVRPPVFAPAGNAVNDFRPPLFVGGLPRPPSVVVSRSGLLVCLPRVCP
jgi:hypothetical protein